MKVESNFPQYKLEKVTSDNIVDFVKYFEKKYGYKVRDFEKNLFKLHSDDDYGDFDSMHIKVGDWMLLEKTFVSEDGAGFIDETVSKIDWYTAEMMFGKHISDEYSNYQATETVLGDFSTRNDNINPKTLV